jgi:hypothetical protein
VNFDLAWDRREPLPLRGEGLTELNQIAQIRLGLGQLLDFSDTVSTARAPQEVIPVLALETEPIDSAR